MYMYVATCLYIIHHTTGIGVYIYVYSTMHWTYRIQIDAFVRSMGLFEVVVDAVLGLSGSIVQVWSTGLW